MLHHPARAAAGAAGIDQTGGITAADLHNPGFNSGPGLRSVTCNKRGPIVIFIGAKL
jgi:hypothetical protein